MCEILEVTKIRNHILINCTPYEGEFLNSKTLKIYDEQQSSITTKDFSLDRTRQCFNNNGVSPWIKLKPDIPENFLKKGNRIELS